MNSSSCGIISEVGSLINAVITWGLVVVGWVVVADQQRSESYRQHVMLKMDALKSSIRNLEDVGVAFHTGTFDEARSILVLRNLQNIALELRYLRLVGAIDDAWISHMVILRQSLTRQNFEENGHIVHVSSSPVVKGVVAAHNSMMEFLLGTQFRAYSLKKTLLDSVKSVLK